MNSEDSEAARGATKVCGKFTSCSPEFVRCAKELVLEQKVHDRSAMTA